MFLIPIFIAIQCSLLLIMALHDWLDLPPLTDIATLSKHHSVKDRLLSSLVNTIMVLIPLGLTIYYQSSLPYWACITLVVFYGVLTIGTLFTWWIPYIFGSSYEHKQGFIEYKNTHHFLPPRGNNVIPNTLHCILHLHVWICFVISVWLPLTQTHSLHIINDFCYSDYV